MDTITSWLQFEQVVRRRGCNLLRRLDRFPDSILVAGCQRSGTTMLSRIITQSDGMANYWFGRDDELDAALILSGYIEHTPQPQGRYCFQTTYLDNCYEEYCNHSGNYKLIWVLRNPFSVIFSLLYNWPESALDNTFQRTGASLLNGPQKWFYKMFGLRYVGRIRRACLTYNYKVAQINELAPRLGPEQVIVVDYDYLVQYKEVVLPQIYRFVDLPYQKAYGNKIHAKSITKANRLSDAELTIIRHLSEPVYTKAKKWLTKIEG